MRTEEKTIWDMTDSELEEFLKSTPEFLESILIVEDSDASN